MLATSEYKKDNRFSGYLSPTLAEEVKAFTSQHDLTYSQFLRLAVTHYLRTHADQITISL